MNREITLWTALRECIQENLPGRNSQYRMAPGIRLENVHDLYRNAAVMILLYRREGNWHFVLMKRPEYIGAHSNQVSLPGGIREDADPDLQTTALRETREELGLDDSLIRVAGALTTLEIPVSGIEVTPFIGIFPGKPLFRPDPHEVSYLIEVPLKDLLMPEKVKQDVRTILCKPVKVPYFHLCGEQVWGATAMILSEFLEIIRKLKEGNLR
jgi:8-oxo-dGTP pyrophosphatase MutT (NUDIX family)